MEAAEPGDSSEAIEAFLAERRLGCDPVSQPALTFEGVGTYAERLLHETVAESFDGDERRRLLEVLDSNAPLREDVLTLLATFKVNLGPFFLRALLDRLDGTAEDGTEDPIPAALRVALAIPVGEICDELIGLEQADPAIEKA